MSEFTSPPSIVDTIRELDARIADIVIGPPPAWQTPAFENGWLAFGAGYSPPTYMRDMIGIVHLRGLMKTGTVPSSAFRLPVGFRPNYICVFVVQTATGPGRIDVAPAGEVVVQSGSNAFVSLEGVSFLAER